MVIILFLKGDVSMNDMLNQSSRDFLADLASDKPAPGGGGASSLVAALGTALGQMVVHLTQNKKKYTKFQSDYKRILSDLQAKQTRLEELVTEDAIQFLPLSKAYGLPETTEAEKSEKNQVMQKALLTACEVPLEIMKLSSDVLDIHEELVEKGSPLVLSDVGVGVSFLKAAVESASLNVRINIKMMTSSQEKDKLAADMSTLLKKVDEQGNRVFKQVVDKLSN